MAKTVLTPIEEKKKNIDDINESNKPNKWLSFGTSIITNILIVLFVGIIGANFIYMTSAINKVDNAGVTLLEKLLPTDKSTYFPQNETLKGGSSCSSSKEYSTNWTNLNNIGIGKKGGWLIVCITAIVVMVLHRTLRIGFLKVLQMLILQIEVYCNHG